MPRRKLSHRTKVVFIVDAALLVVVVAVIAVALGMRSGVSGPAAAAGSPPAQSPTVAATTADPAQVAACRKINDIVWFVGSQDGIAVSQNSLGDALNLLPSGDPLGTNLVAVDKDLVTLDTDLLGVNLGTAGAQQTYRSDLGVFQSHLTTVAVQCRSLGAQVQPEVVPAPTG